jgi:hypothetical protein
MKTLQHFASKPETIPAATSWYLADLGEARGDIWDAGKYKEKDSDIIEKYPDGRD